MMPVDFGALVVIGLYALALYVIHVVSPRLSPELRQPQGGWRGVKFWATVVAVTQILVYALFS